MSTLDEFLNTSDSEKYSTLSGKEYMFHQAVERDLLMDVLEKFSKAQKIYDYLDKIYFNKKPLKGDWRSDLLNEVNALLDCMSNKNSLSVKTVELGEPDYNSGEMFTLRVAGNRFFRDALKKTHSGSEAIFLSEFFYGLDFTNWTRFAVLSKYTDLDVELSTIASVVLSGIRVSISGEGLVVDRLPESPEKE